MMWIKTQTGKLLNLDKIVFINAYDEARLTSPKEESTPYRVRAIDSNGDSYILRQFKTMENAIEYRDKLARKIGTVNVS